jgi:dipeptidase D
MITDVKVLQPRAVWKFFAEISAIPRGSKKEHAVSNYVVRVTTAMGLKPEVDAAGNVLVRKPAPPISKNQVTTAVQVHLDMVQQKNATTEFDFDRQGIELQVDGDYVRACGTTLGADNGIGVAAALALLALSDIPHPPLEVLFTVDEETGMSGAKGLEPAWLTASIMLNLDTEDDTELTIGCAGGVHVTARGTYATDEPNGNWLGQRLSVRGLSGGHSGMDIHLGRGNANKILNRLLCRASDDLLIRIAAINGGGLSNAIPREAFADLSVDRSCIGSLESLLAEQESLIRIEYRTTDPSLEICLESIALPQMVWPSSFQHALLRAIQICPNGIHRLSPDVPGLVQTSNNFARVHVKDGSFEIQCLCRSSVDSEKQDLAQTIAFALEDTKGSVILDSDYPGWTPRPESGIVELMGGLYRAMFNQEPHINACHAGLECGIIGSKYPEMEIISFGPNIHGAHSPDEHVQVSSVQKFWSFLLETLKRIPQDKVTTADVQSALTA